MLIKAQLKIWPDGCPTMIGLEPNPGVDLWEKVNNALRAAGKQDQAYYMGIFELHVRDTIPDVS